MCPCGAANVDVILDGGTRVCREGHENCPCLRCGQNNVFGEVDAAESAHSHTKTADDVLAFTCAECKERKGTM